MNDKEKAIVERAKQVSHERTLRKEKHLVISKIADDVYQRCVSQNLNCEDVEALCEFLVAKAKRSSYLLSSSSNNSSG